MRAEKGQLYKALAETELPDEYFAEIEIENDGATRVKLFGHAKEVLNQRVRAMRKFFYVKPHINDVANALIQLSLEFSDELVAETIDQLPRKKPVPANPEA